MADRSIPKASEEWARTEGIAENGTRERGDLMFPQLARGDARTPMFLDRLLNIWTNENHPYHIGHFVEVVRSQGTRCFRLTDGKGHFWTIPARSLRYIDATPPLPAGRAGAEGERIAIGFVNFPAADGEEYDEPEVQPYLAVLERLQQRLVPFTNSKGVTLELFVEVTSAPPTGRTEGGALPDLYLSKHTHGNRAGQTVVAELATGRIVGVLADGVAPSDGGQPNG